MLHSHTPQLLPLLQHTPVRLQSCGAAGHEGLHGCLQACKEPWEHQLLCCEQLLHPVTLLILRGGGGGGEEGDNMYPSMCVPHTPLVPQNMRDNSLE